MGGVGGFQVAEARLLAPPSLLVPGLSKHATAHIFSLHLSAVLLLKSLDSLSLGTPSSGSPVGLMEKMKGRCLAVRYGRVDSESVG